MRETRRKDEKKDKKKRKKKRKREKKVNESDSNGWEVRKAGERPR